MSFVRPVPWTRQPQGVVGVNWGNPLTRGLVMAVLPGVAEYFTNGQPTIRGIATVAANVYGRSANTVYTGTGANDITYPCNISASGDRTFAVYASNVGAAANYIETHVIDDADSRDVLHVGTSVFYSIMDNNAAGDISIVESATPRLFAARRTSNLVSAACNSSFGTGSITGTRALTSSTVRIGRNSGASNTLGSQTYLVLYWNRAISNEEMATLWPNPWQLFAPISRRILVPSAGGATTHTSTGALTAQAASIAGTATHKTLHTSTGALSSQAASIAGTATHKTLHASTGALAAQAAAIAGTATHTTPSGATHTATGALAAQAAEIAGTAIHRILHTSTGDLIAQSAAVIAGTAIHYALHTSSGALASQSATIAGSASGPGPDDVSGDTIVALRSISHNTHRRM